jgi:hypothetical protein
MLISPALAAHFTPPSESAGGGVALAIIIAGVIALFLVYRGHKKWRKRKLEGDGGGE